MTAELETARRLFCEGLQLHPEKDWDAADRSRLLPIDPVLSSTWGG
jgi:hypothetical protein